MPQVPRIRDLSKLLKYTGSQNSVDVGKRSEPGHKHDRCPPGGNRSDGARKGGLIRNQHGPSNESRHAKPAHEGALPRIANPRHKARQSSQCELPCPCRGTEECPRLVCPCTPYAGSK